MGDGDLVCREQDMTIRCNMHHYVCTSRTNNRIKNPSSMEVGTCCRLSGEMSEGHHRPIDSQRGVVHRGKESQRRKGFRLKVRQDGVCCANVRSTILSETLPESNAAYAYIPGRRYLVDRPSGYE